VLIVLGLLSLSWSQWRLSLQPEASFYLLQSRAFELTIGVLLARLNWKLESRAAQLFSVVGVALLIVAIFFYNDRTRFPGLAALVPCLGAALIIWSGQTETVLSRILSFPTLVYVGKISYPLYLVHWPLIVFGKIAMPEAPELHFSLSVVAASFIAAVAIYHTVERPIRTGSFTLVKASFLGAAASLSAVGAVVALLAGGFEGRSGPRAQQLDPARHPGSGLEHVARCDRHVRRNGLQVGEELGVGPHHIQDVLGLDMLVHIEHGLDHPQPLQRVLRLP
jgi:peptidoglycan/LPS O-acetylase OafA/YrhL